MKKKKEMSEAKKIDWVADGMEGADLYVLAKEHIVAELKSNKKKLDEEYEFYKEMGNDEEGEGKTIDLTNEVEK